MAPDSLECLLANCVNEVIGYDFYRYIDYRGRLADGRLNYVRAHRSECEACSVVFLKEHVATSYDNKYCQSSRKARQRCKNFALARAMERVGSREKLETGVMEALRRAGFHADEVSVGRGNADNMSVSIRFTDAERDAFNSRKVRRRTESKISRQLAEVYACLDAL